MWNAWVGDRYQQPSGFGPIGWIPDIPIAAFSYAYPVYDRHVLRSGDDYIPAMQAFYPEGSAWPREDIDSRFMLWVDGTSQIWGDVDAAADKLLVRESDPRTTMDLLPDWERNFGLPDDCLAEPYTIAQRQAALVARITMFGSQSRQFYQNLAIQLGQKIDIIEHSPFTCGLSQCGDTRYLTESGAPRWELGDPIMRFYWTIDIRQPSLTWFRCGGGSECGKDPFLQFGLSTDLNCIWYRLKPAHTQLAFQFNFSDFTPTQGAESTGPDGLPIFIDGPPPMYPVRMTIPRPPETVPPIATPTTYVLAGTSSLNVSFISKGAINPKLAGAGSLGAAAAITGLDSAKLAGAGSLTANAIIPGVGFDSATTAWASAVVTAGGTVSGTRKTLVDALIVGLKSDGIWTKIDRLWIFAAENSQSALIDLVVLTQATAVSSPTFTIDRGYAGNGSSAYIDSNFNPTSGSPNYTQNSASYFVWNNTSGLVGSPWVASQSSSFMIIGFSVNNHDYFAINDAVPFEEFTSQGGGTGLYTASRTSSSAAGANFYFNGGSSISIGGTSGAVGSADFLVLTQNAANFGTRQLSCAGIGGGLSSAENTLLYNRLRTYMTAVGVP